MANYQEVLNNFKQQWNLPDYNLDELANNVQRFRYTDEFLMGGSGDNSPAGQYVKWFSRTLSIYFATNTTPSEAGKYMSSFDAQDFYDSFKELVQAKYDADAEERGEVALQVSEVATNNLKSTIQNVIANCKRAYKKTLPTMWQENLKKGLIDMQNLRNITSQAHTAITNKYYVDENEMAGNLTNIVAAREAMKQLRASRSGVWGWLWKVIFNRSQNRQEKEYLRELDSQITQLKEKGYKMEKFAERLTGKTVFGKDVTAENTASEKQIKQAPKAQKDPVQNLVQPKGIKPVAGQINEMANSEYINNLAATLSNELPGNGMAHIVRVWDYQTALGFVIKAVNVLNENFDRAVENGADPKKEMAKVVHGVFKETEKYFSKQMTETGLDKMEGLKIAATIITNALTASAIYPKELGDVVNEYIERNLAIYEEIVTEEKVYAEEIESYKQMMEVDAVVDDDYEPAFGEENPFVDKGVHKSAPISGQIKQDVPHLDKK